VNLERGIRTTTFLKGVLSIGWMSVRHSKNESSAREGTCVQVPSQNGRRQTRRASSSAQTDTCTGWAMLWWIFYQTIEKIGAEYISHTIAPFLYSLKVNRPVEFFIVKIWIPNKLVVSRDYQTFASRLQDAVHFAQDCKDIRVLSGLVFSMTQKRIDSACLDGKFDCSRVRRLWAATTFFKNNVERSSFKCHLSCVHDQIPTSWLVLSHSVDLFSPFAFFDTAAGPTFLLSLQHHFNCRFT
jgi:hypothetical protein